MSATETIFDSLIENIMSPLYCSSFPLPLSVFVSCDLEGNQKFWIQSLTNVRPMKNKYEKKYKKAIPSYNHIFCKSINHLWVAINLFIFQ